jgi:hypothetical protein
MDMFKFVMNKDNSTWPNQASTGCVSILIFVSIPILVFVSVDKNLFYWKFYVKIRIAKST